MKAYGVNELRRMFLEFFESKGHLAMKSFSLVPHNDNSLLLINSCMASKYSLASLNSTFAFSTSVFMVLAPLL